MMVELLYWSEINRYFGPNRWRIYWSDTITTRRVAFLVLL